MKTLGLDVGEKTIGVAVSDALHMTAQSVETIQWSEQNFETAVQPLERIIKDYEVSKIIVGLPKNMNGTIGPRAEASQHFADFLRSHFSLPVELWDERLTTMAAERILLEADVSRKKRKLVIDKMAAAMILQSYLDANR
ncbi:Holliday junction resolvase RuvX [Bacillaceae bacterium W0354]